MLFAAEQRGENVHHVIDLFIIFFYFSNESVESYFNASGEKLVLRWNKSISHI